MKNNDKLIEYVKELENKKESGFIDKENDLKKSIIMNIGFSFVFVLFFRFIIVFFIPIFLFNVYFFNKKQKKKKDLYFNIKKTIDKIEKEEFGLINIVEKKKRENILVDGKIELIYKKIKSNSFYEDKDYEFYSSYVYAIKLLNEIDNEKEDRINKKIFFKLKSL